MNKLKREETSSRVIYTLDHTRWTFDKRDHSKLQDVFDYLYAYQVAEADGKLVKLPCAVGDKVFFIGYGVVEELTAQFIEYHENGDGDNCAVVWLTGRSDGTTEQIEDIDFGRIAFHTREKADAALETLKGGSACD